MTLNPSTIAAVAGILISLAASYIPGLSEWYANLKPVPKRLSMLAALAVATLGILAYQCRGDGACYSANVETAITAFIAALVANQSTDRISP